MNYEERGKFVRKITSQVRDREYPYKSREKTKINWHDYNLAQCREIGDVTNLINLFDAKLGLSQQFAYKTIEREYDKKSVDHILNVIFQLTNEPVRKLEMFSVDGSGSPTSVKQNYAHDRQRQRGGKNAEKNDLLASSTLDPKHDHVYKIAVIGTEYKLFSGWISIYN
jgi:hypothetical protein